MKALLSVVLSFSLLLQGCYSFDALDAEEPYPFQSLEGEQIKVTIKDETEIESDGCRHVLVTTPSHFILGRGMSVSRGANPHGYFQGIIPWTSVDSLWASPPPGDGTLTCRLRDSSVITFRHRDHLIFTPDLGTGFWVVGEIDGAPVQVMLMPQNIRELEVRRVSAFKTALLVASITFMAVVDTSGPMFGESWGARR